MMKLKTPVVIAAFAAVLMTNSCSEGGGINIFSLEDDIKLEVTPIGLLGFNYFTFLEFNYI